MNERTSIKSIVDRVIGSVEMSKENPAHYVIKDKEGLIIACVEALYCYDKNWNWFDDSNIEMEGGENDA